ncbi:MAG: hypothetical protein ACLR9T_12655 [Thomasclavelia sp.]|uniref:hypothetical protein n=1 Tax=Thomasclavelia sp. TaxID=3025757 RepID=UPI0039A249D3
MSGRKLISFLIKAKDQDHIIITLLKENTRYLVRTEYEHIGDKIKETNYEIDRNLVYQIFCNLEVAEFDELDNVDNSEEVANMKVYYGDQEYLERKITKPLLKKADGLNNVIKCLIKYVDESLNRSVFV